jgi:hypothetical protein
MRVVIDPATNMNQANLRLTIVAFLSNSAMNIDKEIINIGRTNRLGEISMGQSFPERIRQMKWIEG